MTRERIEDMREVVLPFVKKRLLETNYENLGESDAEMFAKDFDEILNLAIKALKQVPTPKNDLGVDAISRADAIKAMQERSKKLKNLDTINGLCGAVAILYDMPSVTPQEPRWIPVSEKLPEPYMFVNATCRSLVDDRDNWVVETIYLPIPKEHNPRHYSDWGNIPMLNWGEAEVIAWMKRIIPEPYKMVEPQESENER